MKTCDKCKKEVFNEDMTSDGMCADCVQEYIEKCHIVFNVYPYLDNRSQVSFGIRDFIHIIDSISFNFNTLMFDIKQKDLRE